MTLLEVASLISSFGIAWRKDHFSETPSTPYCVYYYPSEPDFHADDSNYVNRRQLFIEVFVKGTDTATEATVEAKLKANDLSWYKSRDYLNDEKLYQITYETEVIING